MDITLIYYFDNLSINKDKKIKLEIIKYIKSGHQIIVITKNSLNKIFDMFYENFILLTSTGNYLKDLQLASDYVDNNFVLINNVDKGIHSNFVDKINSYDLNKEFKYKIVFNSFIKSNLFLRKFSKFCDKLNHNSNFNLLYDNNYISILPWYPILKYFKDNKELPYIKYGLRYFLENIISIQDFETQILNINFNKFAKLKGELTFENIQNSILSIQNLVNELSRYRRFLKSDIKLDITKDLNFNFCKQLYLVKNKEKKIINSMIDEVYNLNKIINYSYSDADADSRVRDIVFISDINQIDIALINSYSIINQTKKRVTIHIICVDMIESEILSVITKAKKISDWIKIHNYDSTRVPVKSKLKLITNATNVRLHIHNILPEIKSVLYLDNDTVVMGDIQIALHFFDPNKHYARRWSTSSYWPIVLNDKNLINKHRYVNAGVIHLNLDNLRSNHFEKIVEGYYEKYKDFIKYADQDILNLSLDFQDMPMNFNIARDIWAKTFPDYHDGLKIYHFLSTDKQWSDRFGLEERTISNLTKDEIKKLQPAREFWLKEKEKYLSTIND